MVERDGGSVEGTRRVGSTLKFSLDIIQGVALE